MNAPAGEFSVIVKLREGSSPALIHRQWRPDTGSTQPCMTPYQVSRFRTRWGINSAALFMLSSQHSSLSIYYYLLAIISVSGCWTLHQMFADNGLCRHSIVWILDIHLWDNVRYLTYNWWCNQEPPAGGPWSLLHQHTSHYYNNPGFEWTGGWDQVRDAAAWCLLCSQDA